MKQRLISYWQLKSHFKTQHKRLKPYLLAVMVPVLLYHSLATKDYWRLLFLSCIALYAPLLWTCIGVYLIIKARDQYLFDIHYVLESSQSDFIKALEQNDLVKLKEAIKNDPEILYCDYQRRSLTAWCRYYKNTAAQELVMQMMNEFPLKSLAA